MNREVLFNPLTQDYSQFVADRYKKEFKVNMEFIIIGHNGSEYCFKTYKVYNRYYYSIYRYNDLFNKWDLYAENNAGNTKDDLYKCVIRQIGYLTIRY